MKELDEVNGWINSWKKIFNERFKKVGKDYKVHVIPKVYCKDGFNVSIQASSGHYCSPRNEEKLLEFNYDDSDIIHGAFELGFPSKEDSLIQEYAEEPKKPTATVYGYVPLERVVDLINKHGGIDYKKSLYEQAKEKSTTP